LNISKAELEGINNAISELLDSEELASMYTVEATMQPDRQCLIALKKKDKHVKPKL